MKQLITILAAAIICNTASAQTDSTKAQKKDTIRIGGMVIIKKGKDYSKDRGVDITMGRHDSQKKRNSNVSTNWWIVDIGLSNYDDKTNYGATGGYLVNRPGYPAINANDFKLRAGKSVNINLWFFMQKLNLAKHYVNLKYGLGLEMNNYRYKTLAPLSYKEGGPVPYSTTSTNAPFIFKDSVEFSKNKLAADYLTVPLMLNFNTNPNSKKKGLSISAGVSAGYLYSQRNKQKSNARGKETNKGDYDLERLKFSYVAEVGVGPVRFYGSYSPKSIYKSSLDMRPYNVGFRISNW